MLRGKGDQLWPAASCSRQGQISSWKAVRTKHITGDYKHRCQTMSNKIQVHANKHIKNTSLLSNKLQHSCSSKEGQKSLTHNTIPKTAFTLVISWGSVGVGVVRGWRRGAWEQNASLYPILGDTCLRNDRKTKCTSG